MEAAKPVVTSDESLKDAILSDLRENYKTIIIKHLDGRTFNQDKIGTWVDNILIDAKDYFIKKYPNYDLFFFVLFVK